MSADYSMQMKLMQIGAYVSDHCKAKVPDFRKAIALSEQKEHMKEVCTWFPAQRRH